ncbi:hypothetical protein [Jiella sonneratiae]|uniref:Uncharacterized protein n=1 Tax=Jiella sonneratiae TaxID=2816856 RepID=A0ABS3J208_9HYPH|nr:hypothetical protein [Jiella sonneratiae]MBO0902606.1 hypothetical protein [Jiella sonneratiae]
MRKLIIASALAFAASLGAGAAAQAADVKVVIGDTHAPAPRHHVIHKGPVVVEKVKHHKDCYTKKVVRYHHGKKVVEKTKVCH